jgi:DNA polymerase delta subunit 1
VQVKSVVTYGKHWVRQQARMSSTSNQEVYRAYVEGRLVIDMLRVVLVSFNLSTFTLGECSQVSLFLPIFKCFVSL